MDICRHQIDKRKMRINQPSPELPWKLSMIFKLLNANKTRGMPHICAFLHNRNLRPRNCTLTLCKVDSRQNCV